MFVCEGGRCCFVKMKTSRLLDSEGNYTPMHFNAAHPQLFRSLNAIEERLVPKYLSRANRRNNINLVCIVQIQQWFSGGLIVHLKRSAIAELSPRQAQEFRFRMSL